jgi:hypothetical protein
VVWSRRARPDRGDAPNVGVRFQRLEGAGENEVAAVVARELGASRRPSVAERRVFRAPEEMRAAAGATFAVAVEPPVTATAAAMATAAVPLPSETSRPASPVVVSRATAVPRTEAAPTIVPAVLTRETLAAPAPAPPAPAPPRATVSTPGTKPTTQRDEALPLPPAAPPRAAGETARSTMEIEDDAAPQGGAKRRRLAWIALAGTAATVVAIVSFLSLSDGGEAVRAPTGGVEPAPPAIVGDTVATVQTADLVTEAAEAAAETAAIPVSDSSTSRPPAEPVSIPASDSSTARPPVEPIADQQPVVAATTGLETAPAAPASAQSAAADGARAESAPDARAPDRPVTEARARQLMAIEPSAADDGEIVVLRGDAPFRAQDVFTALIGLDPPRYLLRLSGIERPWRPADIDVGSPLVQRVRTGLHSTPRGPELHVVLDLSTRAVEHSFEIEGETLRVRLRPAGR